MIVSMTKTLRKFFLKMAMMKASLRAHLVGCSDRYLRRRSPNGSGVHRQRKRSSIRERRHHDV